MQALHNNSTISLACQQTMRPFFSGLDAFSHLSSMVSGWTWSFKSILRAEAVIIILFFFFFHFYETDEGKHALHLHFLADCSGDWPFHIGLPYVSVPHVYHFHKRSASQCSFRSNTRHYMRKKPTPLAHSLAFSLPPVLFRSLSLKKLALIP